MSNSSDFHPMEPVHGTSDPFAEQAAARGTPAAGSLALTETMLAPEEEAAAVEELHSATADLRLRLLVWATRLAFGAVIVVGVWGIIVGLLSVTSGASAELAARMQQQCLIDALAAAVCGMAAAAARAGAIDRRRHLVRALARQAAERARRDAAARREAARKAAVEREAAETAAREARRAALAAQEATEAELEAERIALVEAMEDAARAETERQAESVQRERDRKALEERVERAIRDGTRAA